MNKDLKWIKKYYSEEMMKLCRRYFSTILEYDGLLPKVLNENFHNYRYLATDIIEANLENAFKNFILSKVNLSKFRTSLNTNKNPYELLEEVGYTLYKCETEEDLEKFRSCYEVNELLCSFNNGSFYSKEIFFAIKNNYKEIKRKTIPNREDEYGTSVISIQFNKGEINDVSIKNRYNHTVLNPDATFSNNLDNIIEGLTNSFEREFSYNIQNSKEEVNFEFLNYIQGIDNKYYKCIKSFDDNYYCVDNIVISNDEVIQYDKEKYIIMETYIVDLFNKDIYNIEPFDKKFENCFESIEKIEVKKLNGNKVLIIKEKDYLDESVIVLNQKNEIIKLYLPNVEYIGNDFLIFSENIEVVILPKVRKIGNCFLILDMKLEKILLPNVEYIGNDFLGMNNNLEEISLPKLKEIRDNALISNVALKELMLPNIEIIGNCFLADNKVLNNIYIPKLKKVGMEFLSNNKILDNLDLSNVEVESLEDELVLKKKLKELF